MSGILEKYDALSEYVSEPRGARNALLATGAGLIAIGGTIETVANTTFEEVMGFGFIAVGSLVGLAARPQHHEYKREQARQSEQL